MTAVDCVWIMAGETGDTYTAFGLGLRAGHSALAWNERGVTGGGRRLNGTGLVSSICELFCGPTKLNAAAMARYFHSVLSGDHPCGFDSIIRRSVRTAGGHDFMEPELLRYSAEMVMASFVVRGLPFARRIALDQVMHTLRGDHEVHDSSKKSGINPHACFSSFLVVAKAAGDCHSMENSSMARRFAMPAKDRRHKSGSMMHADCMWTPQPVAIVRQNGQANSSFAPS